MSVPYPPYSHLFASETDRLPVGYCRKLKKKYIKAVLRDLRHTAHYAYALLGNAPKTRFAIIRYYDYRQTVGAFQPRGGDDFFTLGEFLRHAGLFHARDCFRVLLAGEVFYYEQGFTPGSVEKLFLHALRSFCEQRLRENNPVSGRDFTHGYGLTKADARIVRQYIASYNSDAADKVQQEYDALITLDCIDRHENDK